MLKTLLAIIQNAMSIVLAPWLFLTIALIKLCPKNASHASEMQCRWFIRGLQGEKYLTLRPFRVTEGRTHVNNDMVWLYSCNLKHIDCINSRQSYVS